MPDLRPDEARDAKGTAEKVVRCVLDWLERYPAAYRLAGTRIERTSIECLEPVFVGTSEIRHRLAEKLPQSAN